MLEDVYLRSFLVARRDRGSGALFHMALAEKIDIKLGSCIREAHAISGSSRKTAGGLRQGEGCFWPTTEDRLNAGNGSSLPERSFRKVLP